MLGYDRTITRTNINVLLNIGPWTGYRKEKKRLKDTFLTLPVITLGVTTSCKIYTNYIFDFIVRMNS